jgi:NMT1-like family
MEQFSPEPQNGEWCGWAGPFPVATGRRRRQTVGVLHKLRMSKLVNIFTETFGMGRGAATAAVALLGLTILFAVYNVVHWSPPAVLTITSGPPGSVFERYALTYSNILAKHKVKVKVVPSKGSEENLERLSRHGSLYSVGFVQVGVTMTNKPGVKIRPIVSLGSIMYEPLWVFHNTNFDARLIRDFEGRRLAIGEPGSGSHGLSELLLATNGIVRGGTTTLLEVGGDEGVTNLLAGKVDAVFLMTDSVSTNTMRRVLRNPQVKLFDFVTASAYARRFPFLNKLEIPEGGLDFARNFPDHNLHLIGPTVELVAGSDLHPVLSDLLLGAAKQVHGKPSMLQQRDEFPSPQQHDIPISADALRYYKSGPSFLYRNMPFEVARFLDRLIAVVVPMAIVLIPGLKIIPTVLRWRVKLVLFRWYRSLVLVERGLHAAVTPEKQRELLRRLDEIEATVKDVKLPASFADQVYGLRGHISFVRERLSAITAKSAAHG